MVFNLLQNLVNLVTSCTTLDKSQKTEMLESFSTNLFLFFFSLSVKEGTKVKDFVFSQSNSSYISEMLLGFFPSLTSPDADLESSSLFLNLCHRPNEPVGDEGSGIPQAPH